MCTDLTFSSLTIIFNKDEPIINNHTASFKIYLDPREDMSTLYVRGKYMIGSNVKKNYIFYNYNSLKMSLGHHLLDSISKKFSKGSGIRMRPRKNSVPDNLGSRKKQYH